MLTIDITAGYFARVVSSGGLGSKQSPTNPPNLGATEGIRTLDFDIGNVAHFRCATAAYAVYYNTAITRCPILGAKAEGANPQAWYPQMIHSRRDHHSTWKDRSEDQRETRVSD